LLVVVIIAGFSMLQPSSTAEATAPTAFAASISTYSGTFAGPSVTSFSPDPRDGIDDTMFIRAQLNCWDKKNSHRDYPAIAIFPGACSGGEKKINTAIAWWVDTKQGRCKDSAGKDCKNMVIEKKWDGTYTVGDNKGTIVPPGDYCVRTECRGAALSDSNEAKTPFNKANKDMDKTSTTVKVTRSTAPSSALVKSFYVFARPDGIPVGSSTDVVIDGTYDANAVLTITGAGISKTFLINTSSTVKLPRTVTLTPTSTGDITVKLSSVPGSQQEKDKWTAATTTVLAYDMLPRSIRAGATESPGGPYAWVQSSGDASHKGWTPDTGANNKTVGLKWTWAGGEVTSQPVVSADSIAYVTTKDGFVHAISMTDGSELWKLDYRTIGETGGPWLALGTVMTTVDRTVTTGSTSGGDDETGEVPPQSTATIKVEQSKPALFVATGGGIIALDTAIEPAGDRSLWMWQATQGVSTASADGTGDEDTPDTAPTIQGRYITTAPTYYNGNLYVPASDGIIKVNDQGKTVWNKTSSTGDIKSGKDTIIKKNGAIGKVVTSPAIVPGAAGENMVYFATQTTEGKSALFAEKDYTPKHLGVNDNSEAFFDATWHGMKVKGTLPDGNKVDCGKQSGNGKKECGKTKAGEKVTCKWQVATGRKWDGAAYKRWANGFITDCWTTAMHAQDKAVITSDVLSGAVVATTDRLFATGNDGKVYSFQKSDLSRTIPAGGNADKPWSGVGSTAGIPPVIAGDISEKPLVYLAGSDSISALAASTGASVWSYSISGGVAGLAYSPFGRAVYVSGKDGKMYAFNAGNASATGTLSFYTMNNPIWSRSIGNNPTAPAIFGKNLLVGSATGLYAFVADTNAPSFGTEGSGTLFPDDATEDGNFITGASGEPVFADAAFGGHVEDDVALDKAWIESDPKDLLCQPTVADLKSVRSADVIFSCTPQTKKTTYGWRLCANDTAGNVGCTADSASKGRVFTTTEKPAADDTPPACQWTEAIMQPPYLQRPENWQYFTADCTDDVGQWKGGVKDILIQRCSDFKVDTKTCNVAWTDFVSRSMKSIGEGELGLTFPCSSKKEEGGWNEPVACYDTTDFSKTWAYKIVSHDWNASNTPKEVLTWFNLFNNIKPTLLSAGIDDRVITWTSGSLTLAFAPGESVLIDKTRISLASTASDGSSATVWINGQLATIKKDATFAGKDAAVKFNGMDGQKATLHIPNKPTGVKEAIGPGEPINVITVWDDKGGFGKPAVANLFALRYDMKGKCLTPGGRTGDCTHPIADEYAPVVDKFSMTQGTGKNTNQWTIKQAYSSNDVGGGVQLQVQVFDYDTFADQWGGVYKGDEGRTAEMELNVGDMMNPSVTKVSDTASIDRGNNFQLTFDAIDDTQADWAVLDWGPDSTHRKQVTLRIFGEKPRIAMDVSNSDYYGYISAKYTVGGKFKQTAAMDFDWKLIVNDTWGNVNNTLTGKFSVNPPCTELDTKPPVITTQTQSVGATPLADGGLVEPGSDVTLTMAWKDEYPADQPLAKDCAKVWTITSAINTTEPPIKKYVLVSGDQLTATATDTFSIPLPQNQVSGGLPVAPGAGGLLVAKVSGPIQVGSYGSASGIYGIGRGMIDVTQLTPLPTVRILPGMAFRWTSYAKDRSGNEGSTKDLHFKIKDSTAPVILNYTAPDKVIVKRSGEFAACLFDWNVAPPTLKLRTNESGQMKEFGTHVMKLNGNGITSAMQAESGEWTMTPLDCYTFTWSNVNINPLTPIAWELAAVDAAGNENKVTGTLMVLSEPPSYVATAQIPTKPVPGEDVLLGKKWKDDLGMKSATLWVDDGTGVGPMIEGQTDLSGKEVWSNFTYTIPVGTAPDTALSWYIDGRDLDDQVTETPDPTIIVGTDTESPKWSDLKQSATLLLPGQSVILSSAWSDNAQLQTITLSTSDGPGDTWFNESVDATGKDTASVSFTWSNPRLAADGSTVNWFMTATDVNGNSNSTPIESFTLADVSAPKLLEQNESDPTPDVGAATTLQTHWNDNVGLDHAIVETNETGVFKNDSTPIMLVGPDATAIYNWKKAAAVLTTVGWRVWAYDGSGNVNVTPIMTFVVGAIDKEPPKVFNLSISPIHPTPGDKIVLYATATDNFGLSNAVFKVNGVNSAPVRIAGTLAYPKYIINTTGLAVGSLVNWTIFVTDAKGLITPGPVVNFTLGAAPKQACPGICPEGIKPLTNFTDCSNSTQTRTVYECGATTEYRCKVKTESQACEVAAPLPVTLFLLPLIAVIIAVAGAYYLRMQKAKGGAVAAPAATYLRRMRAIRSDKL
jgi:hypothetical protein